MSFLLFKSKRFATLQTALLFCFAIIAILQALGCNLLGNNSSKDALPTTVTTILESQNNANSAALIKEVGGLKIEIAANSFNTNYSLKIQKIETEVDPITANIIKSDLTLSQDLLFVSPIYLLTVTAETGASNLRLSAINDALALTYPASLTIQLNNHTRDRAKYNYYTAWADEDKNWFYEPLSKSDDLTTVVKRLLTLGKYYCVIARDKTSSAEAESLEVSPLALTLVASITEKFEQAPEISVSLGTSAQIDFANSSADLPKLRLIAFTPFDFAPQIKSEQLLPPYYKEVPLSLSDLVSQSGALATFSLSLPLTDITYDPAKHPAALFFDASWLSSSNTAYTSNIACISFGKLTRAAAAIVSPLADAVDVFVTNPVVFSFNKEMDPNSLDNALSIVPNTAVTTQYNYVEGSKNELVITPTQNWLYNTAYTITLDSTMTDTTGLAAPAVSSSFTTVAAATLTANLVTPAVLTDVSSDSAIIIAFNSQVATNTISVDNGITIKKDTVTVSDYSLNFSAQDTLLTIEFSQALAEGSTYEITLPASVIKNTYGLPLANDFTAAFTVREPVVVPFTATIVSPLNNAQDIYLNNPVVVDFSKQVDGNYFFQPGIIGNYVVISPAVTFTADYSYTAGVENRLTITPATQWAANTQYTVTIATNTGDMSHEPMAASAQVKFTTIDMPPPEIIFASPLNKDISRQTDKVILSFTKPMNPETFSKGTGVKIRKDNFTETYFGNGEDVAPADYELQWSTDNTSCEIVFSDGLETVRAYEITLDSSVVACEDQIHPAETFVGVFRVCPFARGLGTEASPFEIASATDLISISSHTYFYSRHYKQTEDVDLADYGSSYNGGEGFAPICSLNGGSFFTGVYNGNNKKISNLYINRNSDYQGLFGKIQNAKIHNLFLENVDITTSAVNYTGALAGHTTGSEIRDVRVSGEIAAFYVVGGITGYASDYYGLQSQIIRCSAEIVIKPASQTTRFFGGIVGYLRNSLVSQCFTRVNIEGTQYLGGVVGYSYIAEISDCQSEGRVFGDDISACVGGILGIGDSTTISDCSSDAYNVTGGQRVGGIAGELFNNSGVINCVNNCVNAVTLTGSVYVGRIVGDHSNTTITNCYSREDSTVNGSAPDPNGISISGKHGANASIENLTNESWWTGTVGWNLGTIWKIDTKPIPTLIDVFIPGGFG